MKTSKKMLWMLLALMGMVAMVSCSSDDDFDGNTSGDGIDMSDDGVVLSGEEITSEVNDLLVGAWKSTNKAGHVFSYRIFSDSPDAVRYVFTERGKLELYVNGKQEELVANFGGDYTLDTDWTVNYEENMSEKGELRPYKYYRGLLHMPLTVSDEELAEWLKGFEEYKDRLKLPIEFLFIVNVREDGKAVSVRDSIDVEAGHVAVPTRSIYSDTAYLTKTSDSDRVVVE